jgi:hypothetical protein
MYLPEDLWIIILEYLLNFKKSHKIKFYSVLENIEGIHDSYLYCSSQYPPWSDQYVAWDLPIEYEIPLVSILKDPEKELWLYEYGWCKYDYLNTSCINIERIMVV